ncbi:MAG: hypothetical protein OXG52_13765, partial [bacterium]|nr:hypothetical protein [bacterium]
MAGYPILQLLQQLARTSPEVSAWLHFGATTQDIMDTAVVLLRDACVDIAALSAAPLRAMTARHERSAGEWQM